MAEGDPLGATLVGALKGPFEGVWGSIQNFSQTHSLANGINTVAHAVDTVAQIPSLLWILPGAPIGGAIALGSEKTWDQGLQEQYDILTNGNARRAMGLLFWAYATPVGAKLVQIAQGFGNVVEAAMR